MKKKLNYKSNYFLSVPLSLFLTFSLSQCICICEYFSVYLRHHIHSLWVLFSFFPPAECSLECVQKAQKVRPSLNHILIPTLVFFLFYPNYSSLSISLSLSILLSIFSLSLSLSLSLFLSLTLSHPLAFFSLRCFIRYADYIIQPSGHCCEQFSWSHCWYELYQPTIAAWVVTFRLTCHSKLIYLFS